MEDEGSEAGADGHSIHPVRARDAASPPGPVSPLHAAPIVLSSVALRQVNSDYEVLGRQDGVRLHGDDPGSPPGGAGGPGWEIIDANVFGQRRSGNTARPERGRRARRSAGGAGAFGTEAGARPTTCERPLESTGSASSTGSRACSSAAARRPESQPRVDPRAGRRTTTPRQSSRPRRTRTLPRDAPGPRGPRRRAPA